eukprot:UN10060
MGSTFQNFGLSSYASNQRYIKRKNLERLYEQSIRHMSHGFSFDSPMWRAAVREAQEELGVFPTQINPLAVFNLYRGWSYQDDYDEEDDEEGGDNSNSDDSDIEQGFTSGMKSGDNIDEQRGLL